jgi:predicted RNA binding protein YcfA (HicA-like mRNA interferase family)
VKVREVIRLIEQDGWVWFTTRGSHRQFRHPWKPGKVTVPGSMRDDLHFKTWRSILRQAGLR